MEGFIKKLAVYTISLLCALIQIGCASSYKNEGAFLRRWVRDTKTQDYVGNYNNMVFHPLVFDNLVVGGNNVDGLVAYTKTMGFKKWTYNENGGVSNPGIAVGSYIFFSTYSGKAIALNAANGKLFWSTDIDYPTSKPFVFDNGRIYIHTQNDELISLEASSGERLWTFKRGGSTKIQVSSTNAPVLLGSLIVSGFSDGSIVALEKNNGRERWSRRLNFQNRFRDLTAITLFDKDKLLVGGYDDGIYALNGVDGSVIWKKERAITSNFIVIEEGVQTATSLVPTESTSENSGVSSLVSAPKSGAGTIKACASTLDDKIFCINPYTGEQVQEIRTHSPSTQLAFYDQKLFYGLSAGGMAAFDFKSGATYRYPTFAGVASLPVKDPKQDSIVYFSTNAGNIYSLRYNF